MTGQALVIVMLGLAHVLALGVLIWMLVKSGEGSPGLGWWFGSDQDDEPVPPEGPVAPGGAALPLTSADPSSVRLREPGRISDAHPRPQRRPAHAPRPVRSPERF